MEHSPSTPSISTFMIRLWRVGTGADTRWLGRIVHLQSGQSAAFRRLDAVPAFVQAACGMRKDGRSGGSRSAKQ
jgi:hypothetical protein